MKDRIFSPVEAELMGRAFEVAWASLVEMNSTHAHQSRGVETRTLLAMKIIEVVREGVLDVEKLSSEALRRLGMLPRGRTCRPLS
jgi:hypothetical protein